MAKKRINIYVDEDIYREFKTVVGVTGETVTSVVDQAMKEYIKAMRMILEASDKDALMEMMKKRFEIEMGDVEKGIEEHVKAKKA